MDEALAELRRARDNRACGVIYDTDKCEIRILRCEYDIGAVQAKMKQASLPLFLIERLNYGR